MEGAPEPGAVLLGKYRVEGVLGIGGMGVVVRVTHLQLGEQLALKILLREATSNPEVAGRFLREAQSAARLRGEHVTRVSDVGLLSDGAPYIAMEYLRGVDLSTELGRRRLFPGEAVDYMLQACEALAEAHANDIVHRDIKPSNLFLTTRPDGTPLIKVLDFGISKAPVANSAPVTKTNLVMGTVGYMSPEQMKAARAVDARTDIWSLGIVLYECLCGHQPFEAESPPAIVLKAGTEPPPPMDLRLPRGLQAVVLRCLQKDRAARFPSIAALATALAPFAHDQRAAAIVVERANLMLQRAGGQVAEVVRLPARPLRETTLRSSAGASGAMSSQSRRRLIWGALSVLGAIALVSVLAVLTSTHDDTVVTPGLGITGAPAIDAGESAGPIAGKPVDRGNADVSADASAQLAVDAAVVIAAGEKARMLGVCTQREATQDWQALRECAEGLDKLGVTDEAAAFKAQAVKEQDNEGKANTVRQLIRDHNLKEAQALLAKIGDGSVYYKQLSDALREKAVMEGKANTVLELIRDHKLEEAQTLLAKIGDGSVYYRQLSEAFTKAENAEIDSAVRRAQAFASAHDCAAFRAQQKQLVQSSTARVAGAIAPIKCTEKVAQTESARGNSPSVASANPVGGATVVPTPPAAAVTWPAVSGPCAQNAVDEALELAAHQYSSGYAKAALSQVLKALACKQEIRMFRIAAMYACGAKDLATAKLYVTKLPPYQQGAIVQRCQQEGLDIRQP